MPGTSSRGCGEEATDDNYDYATDSPPGEIKQDADMCVHGLNVQYNHEALKQTVKDLCDDAASDMEKVQKVVYGKIPKGGQNPALIGGKLDHFLSLFLGQGEARSEKDVPTDSGIAMILLFKYPEFFQESVHMEAHTLQLLT